MERFRPRGNEHKRVDSTAVRPPALHTKSNTVFGKFFTFRFLNPATVCIPIEFFFFCDIIYWNRRYAL